MENSSSGGKTKKKSGFPQPLPNFYKEDDPQRICKQAKTHTTHNKSLKNTNTTHTQKTPT